MSQLCSIAILSMMFFTQSTFASWDLNDVSILLPLPQTLPSKNLGSPTSLRAQSSGLKGELIPAAYLDLLPRLTRAASQPGILTVVAMRIDPCFPGGDTLPQNCRRQIRLVWQPLIEASGQVIAHDAAVHSFYDLSSDEFKIFIGEINGLSPNIRNAPTALPLQVSPTLLREGFAGPYWGKLRAVILRHAGEKNISRLTFMTEESPNEMWDFGRFDFVRTPESAESPRVLRMSIPLIGTRLQSFFNLSLTPDEFQAAPRPAQPQASELNYILTESGRMTIHDEIKLLSAATTVHKMENPKLNSPETVDCASCHIAQSVRRWETVRFPILDLNSSPFKFTSAFNLNNMSESNFNAHVLREFGYQGKTPVTSQRVINESAAVAEAMNALGL